MGYAEAQRLALGSAVSWRIRANAAQSAGMIGSYARFSALAEQSEARAAYYGRFTQGSEHNAQNY